MDTAVPADDQHHDLVAILGFDGCQNRSPGGAPGFTVIGATVLVAKFPGPAVVRCVGFAETFDKGLGLGNAGDRGGKGDEAALANLFAKLARAEEGRGHVQLSVGGRQAAAFEDNVDKVIAGFFHILFGQATAAGHPADLGGEISIVLGAAP
ncbi:hypothetical protein D3C76_1320590 [compost metagenome]